MAVWICAALVVVSHLISQRMLFGRYIYALISNATVVVDAIGQDAGVLRLVNNATLNITNGWLSIANRLEIGTGCTVAVELSGSLRVATNLVNNGTLRLTGTASLAVGGAFTNTGLLDIMAWTGTLPAGLENTGTVLDRSLVRLDSPRMDGPDFQLSIQGYTGHGYQLQCRDDLSSGTWTSLGGFVAGAGAPITLTHTNGATAQQRFYRVAVD